MKNVLKLAWLSALAIVAVTSLTTVSADYSEKWMRGERGEKNQPTAEQQAEMEAHKAALEEAVKNNDFAAFEALRVEAKAKKAELMAERTESSDWANRPERAEKEEPTEAERVEKFNELVAYYNENWELPKKEMKKKGKRKWTLNVGQKWKVKAMLNNLDNPEKVAKILTRINEKITAIEESDMDETRKEKVLWLLAWIQEIFEEASAS